MLAPIAVRSDASSTLRRYAPLLVMLAIAFALMLLPHLAHASTSDTSAGALPWESPLKAIRTSFSGPVAYAISLIGIVVCGAMLIWGGEINEFARRAIMLVLVVALIVLANSVLTSLFSSAETLQAPAHLVLKAATKAVMGCSHWTAATHCTGHGI